MTRAATFFFILLMIVIGTFLPRKIQAQTVSVSTATVFNYTSTTDLEHTVSGTTTQAGYNNHGLVFSVNNNNHACHVYIYLSAGPTGPAATPLAASNVIAKFSSTTCPTANYQNLVTADIPMTTTQPATAAFQQKAHSGAYTWNYDVKVTNPLGYSYAPGTYNYTFKVVMTIP